jgi:hypothetical protein
MIPDDSSGTAGVSALASHQPQGFQEATIQRKAGRCRLRRSARARRTADSAGELGAWACLLLVGQSAGTAIETSFLKPARVPAAFSGSWPPILSPDEAAPVTQQISDRQPSGARPGVEFLFHILLLTDK